MTSELKWRPAKFKESAGESDGEGLGFGRRFIKWLRRMAQAYGPVIAILCTSPVIFYFGVQPPSDEFSGLMSVDGPLPAAVRAVVGPTPVELKSFEERIAYPEFVKGIYVSAAAAGTKNFMARLTGLVDRTEINSMVIDIKTDRGQVAFETDNPELVPYVAGNPLLGDLSELLAPLREKGIYLIARQAVFQDPTFASENPDKSVQDIGGGLWRDRRGMTWVDPANREAWKYNVELAREAVSQGFNEVQFDYIRFPTDGRLSRMKFTSWDGVTPKAEVMAEFFDYLNEELRVKDGIITSADLFGMVTNHHDTDLSIGQRLDIAAREFDYISPMVYPSHYPPGFGGYGNPASFPYEIVFMSMDKAREVMDPLYEEDARSKEAGESYTPAATMRPWLQDFDLGADYTPDMVREQMRATTDAGGSSGWLLWNARNVYTEAALQPAVPSDTEPEVE